MDWTVYWFQTIACFIFAAVAMFSGIPGAALMLPWFVMGFLLLGVPEITTTQAITASLFLETAAFSIGIYRYARKRYIDLRVAYSIMMLGAAWLLLKRGEEKNRHEPCPEGEAREMTGESGKAYRFCAHGLRLQRPISGTGAFLTGMISTGVGEVTQPSLIVRSGFPIPIAAATSIVLVAVADISAILTHVAQFALQEGIMAIPWNLIVWGVLGMAAGAFLGSHLQGRVNERYSRYFFAGLFIVLSLTLLVFTFAQT